MCIPVLAMLLTFHVAEEPDPESETNSSDWTVWKLTDIRIFKTKDQGSSIISKHGIQLVRTYRVNMHGKTYLTLSRWCADKSDDEESEPKNVDGLHGGKRSARAIRKAGLKTNLPSDRNPFYPKIALVFFLSASLFPLSFFFIVYYMKDQFNALCRYCILT